MEIDAHNSLTGIATVALVALLCGIAMERFRQPALVGYILAGVLMGPSAFSVVEDSAQIDILAELGVLLLLFIVGMELSLRSFRRIWRLTIMVTAFQIFGSVGAMLFMSLFFELKIELAEQGRLSREGHAQNLIRLMPLVKDLIQGLAE